MVALMALTLAVLYGSRLYVHDQREENTRLTAEAQYAADVASFENARDENLRCVQRAESRAQIRAVFLSVFDLIDAQAGTSTTFGAEARSLLNEDYPPLDPDDCPAIPPAPLPPPSLTADPND
jgi:hypothetical protein